MKNIRIVSLIVAVLALATQVNSQGYPSGAQRVQGTPSGYGDLLQVTDTGLTSAISNSTVATGTKGNPANQLLSVQDANTFYDTGLLTLSSVGAAYTIDLSAEGMAQFSSGTLEITSTGTGGSLAPQCSLGGSNWPTIRTQSVAGGGETGAQSSPGVYYFPVACKSLRFYATALSSGSITFYVRLFKNPVARAAITVAGANGVNNGSPPNPVPVAAVSRTANSYSSNNTLVYPLANTAGAQVNLPYAIPEHTWTTATSAAGLTTTTGVTIAPAAGSGLRNYTSRCNLGNLSATASVVEFRDGTAGTAIARVFIAANANTAAVVFDPPLRGAVNTLTELAANTTASGIVGTCSGYVAQ